MKRAFLFVLAAIAVIAVLSLVPLPFARETRVVDTVTLHQPPQVVYDFVTTPENWPRWHPASLAVQGATDHPLHVGEQVAEEFRLAGRHGIIHWTVVTADPPHEWRLEGEVNRRRAGTVHYTLVADADGHGTRFTREFTYRTPNLLFLILDPIFIGPRMRAESSAAVQQLDQVLMKTAPSAEGNASNTPGMPAPKP